MKTTDTTPERDDELDAFFAAAGRNAPVPDAALLARIQADAREVARANASTSAAPKHSKPHAQGGSRVFAAGRPLPVWRQPRQLASGSDIRRPNWPGWMR